MIGARGASPSASAERAGGPAGGRSGRVCRAAGRTEGVQGGERALGGKDGMASSGRRGGCAWLGA
eukprot:scaffold129408_cov30-Tisochrysis_lutea.AAC.2